MSFLFDENLSPQLTPLLADVYPDSLHVRDVGLARADDAVVRMFLADPAAAFLVLA